MVINQDTERSQHISARIAGLMYLLVLAGAVFGNFFVRSKLIVSGQATETANSIIAHEQLFRIGIVSELASFAGILVLAMALYVLLKPVNKNLALFGLLSWLGEAVILAVIVFMTFSVLRLLSGGDYLNVFQAEQLHALSLLHLAVFYDAYDIGLIFFSLGSTVFSYLLFRAKYVPRVLAAWGVFASLATIFGVFAMILVPGSISLLGTASTMPIFLYELMIGLWLLLVGVNTAAASKRITRM